MQWEDCFAGPQPTATTCLWWSWRLKECFALASAVKGMRYAGLLVPLSAWGYAMLMSPNKDKTAVHGCHCLGEMAVRMQKVPARGSMIVCAACLIVCFTLNIQCYYTCMVKCKHNLHKKAEEEI